MISILIHAVNQYQPSAGDVEKHAAFDDPVEEMEQLKLQILCKGGLLFYLMKM